MSSGTPRYFMRSAKYRGIERQPLRAEKPALREIGEDRRVENRYRGRNYFRRIQYRQTSPPNQGNSPIQSHWRYALASTRCVCHDIMQDIAEGMTCGRGKYAAWPVFHCGLERDSLTKIKRMHRISTHDIILIGVHPCR